jgi:hypothetical protein
MAWRARAVEEAERCIAKPHETWGIVELRKRARAVEEAERCIAKPHETLRNSHKMHYVN